jgi:HKD family nuclease
LIVEPLTTAIRATAKSRRALCGSLGALTLIGRLRKKERIIMNLLLHTPDSDSELADHYRRAFNHAAELFIVTAYLTEWDASLKLNSGCRRFRLIIGKDFGITRKAACETVMRWLTPKRKSQFMVADLIAGFHPKAVFWKESNGGCFAIVGSSNLTRAAFETNYEANVFSRISESKYEEAKHWVRSIEKQSVPVSEDWLRIYKEAAPVRGGGGKKPAKRQAVTSLLALKLPKPAGTDRQIDIRRAQLAAYKKNRKGLINLFRQCAEGQISSAQFYEQLPKYWSCEIGDRLQGAGWERQGKDSDFRALSKSYLRILDAADEDRDDVVEEEIDALYQKRVVTRKAFLSEMLCLQFPGEYPVRNTPV